MRWENKVDMIWGKPVVPVKWYDKVIDRYYMDYDGNVYSTVFCWNTKKLTPSWTTDAKCSMYPTVTLSINGFGKGKKLRIHRLVGYTLLTFICPEGIFEKDWAKTPDAVKMFIYRDAMEINHIDEDPLNFHPSNLEWVTRKGNRDAFHNNPARLVGENYFSKESLHRKAA